MPLTQKRFKKGICEFLHFPINLRQMFAVLWPNPIEWFICVRRKMSTDRGRRICSFQSQVRIFSFTHNHLESPYKFIVEDSVCENVHVEMFQVSHVHMRSPPVTIYFSVLLQLVLKVHFISLLFDKTKNSTKKPGESTSYWKCADWIVTTESSFLKTQSVHTFLLVLLVSFFSWNVFTERFFYGRNVRT